MEKPIFSEFQKEQLKLIQKDHIRKSVMDIYKKLLIENERQNQKCKSKDPNRLKISLSKILGLFDVNAPEQMLAIRTFRDRLDLLEELKIVKVDKSEKINVYCFED